MRPGPGYEILLGFKKVGFGAGKYAGIGGKVEPGETAAGAAVREVLEEIGVIIDEADLQFMGEVTFVFPARKTWSQKVSMFVATQWTGQPVESGEMKPAWFQLENIPYQSMWQDAQYWLPLILEGKAIYATISFEDDNETVDTVSFG